jgi:HSP20 family protein
MSGIRRLMRRMYEDPYFTPDFELIEQSQAWDFPLDVMETKDGYEVKASLPGINPDDLEITYTNNTLTIRGELEEEREETSKEKHYHLRERRYGSFSRSIYLPTPINAGKIKADYESGVLHLDLPKAEESKPKRIPVRATGGQKQKQVEATAKSSK